MIRHCYETVLLELTVAGAGTLTLAHDSELLVYFISEVTEHGADGADGAQIYLILIEFMRQMIQEHK